MSQASVKAGRPAAGPAEPALRFVARYWQALPILLAGVYLIILAPQFKEIVDATNMNADAASAPVIGELLGHGYIAVHLGYLPWYSTLIFELATRWVPHHRVLWEVGPYLLGLASAVLIGGAVLRVAGRWAASISTALLVCASPATLGLLFSLNDHQPTWFSLALIGAWIVVLEHPFARWSPRILALGSVLVGLVVGCNAASDDLLVVAGLVPLALAPLGAWALYPGRRSLQALWLSGVCLLSAIVAAGVTIAAMHAAHITYQSTVAFAAADQIPTNVKLWWQDLALLGNGNFFGSQLNFTGALAAACAILTVGTIVTLPRFAWLQVRVARAAPSGGGDPVTAAPRAAHLLFWILSGVLLTAAFVLGSSPMGLPSDRYLVGVLYAGGALVPLLARGTVGRTLITAGAVVFCLGGVISMADGTATQNTQGTPNRTTSLQIARVVRELGLARGYAGYWDAAPITWQSNFAAKVYPVDSCLNDLCQFAIHNIQSWYRPQAGAHTFVLTDSSQPFMQTLPPNLPKAAATYTFGPITMYVYDYDVATGILF